MADISFQVSECIYRWTAGYDRTNDNVTLRIKLVPQFPISNELLEQLKTTWRSGIIGKWSDKFSCAAGPSAPKIQVDVQWVQSGQHHTVNVHAGPRRSDMTNWDDKDDGNTASHEAGHMFGNPDEYADATTCPSRSPVNTGTVMDVSTGPTARRLYDQICNRTSFEKLVSHEEGVMDKLHPAGAADRITLTLTGGAPGERLVSTILIDKGAGVTEVDQTDELHQGQSHRARAATSAGLIDQVVALTSDQALISGVGATGPFLPDSLVATCRLESRAGAWVLRYALAQITSRVPMGPLAVLYSHVPDSDSTLVHQLHREIVTEGARAVIKNMKP